MHCPLRLVTLRGCVLVVACALGGCSGLQGDVAATRGPSLVRIAHPWGNNAESGHSLKDALERIAPDVRVQLIETSASVTNVTLLQQQQAELAFTFADVAYLAFVGQLPEFTNRFDRLRGIAVLPTAAVQLVAHRGRGIRSPRDLKGARVALGPEGSGSALTAELILRGFGIGPDDVHAEQLPFAEAFERVNRGTLDAAFTNGAYPSSSITRIANDSVELVPIQGPEVVSFRLAYPFFKAITIPARTYPRQDEPVVTLAKSMLLVSRSDLDEETAYRLTKAFFEALTDLRVSVPALEGFDPGRASGSPIPLHPGAARYYRERELFH